MSYKEELEMKYRKAAYKRHHDSGRIEVDLSGEVSVEVGGPRGEVGHGAYVQAWVWVPADDLEDGEGSVNHSHQGGDETCH